MPNIPTLFSLVYHSRAARTMPDAALAALLRKARQHNQQANLTGLLLHVHHEFLQVLEGPEAEVLSLYARIQADPRHHRVITLASGPVAARSFPDWRMGYAPADAAFLEKATGFLPLAAAPGLTAHPAEELTQLLRDFVQDHAQDQ